MPYHYIPIGGGRSARLVRPSEESSNLTIIGPAKTLKTQGFDHKWQDFWSDQGRSGRTGSAGPDTEILKRKSLQSYWFQLRDRDMIY